MIEVSIAHDKTFNELSEFAQLLYLKTLPHTDDFGRFEGDPQILKARVDPLSNKKISKYQSAMSEIARSGLWIWYKLDSGKMVVQYNQIAFERINAFLIKKRGNEEFPEYKDTYKSISSDISSISHIKQQVISNKHKEESKKKYGDDVYLTDEEYAKLEKRLGSSARTDRCIEILDNAKGSKGYKYKSDYKAILSWVIGELEKRESNGSCKFKNTDEKHAVSPAKKSKEIHPDFFCATCHSNVPYDHQCKGTLGNAKSITPAVQQ